MDKIVFFDLEINVNNEIKEIGAIKYEIKEINNLIKIGQEFRSVDIDNFYKFISDCKYICGHNIFNHDLKYLEYNEIKNKIKIDTLLLDPLFFPEEEHHDLIKEYKTEEKKENDPLEDARETKEKFLKQVNEYIEYKKIKDKKIFTLICCALLYNKEKNITYYKDPNNETIFKGFFKYVNERPKIKNHNIKIEIKKLFLNKTCSTNITENIDEYITEHPIELAYVIAAISANDTEPKISKWVKFENLDEPDKTNYPYTIEIFRKLRGTLCNNPKCEYCKQVKEKLLQTKDNYPLSKSQKTIIESKEKNIIINAGPGSGKTEVLIRIIARKILIEHVPPKKILMLSFSKGAVEEFRKRIDELISPYIENTYDLEIRTFHSWCFKKLDEEPVKEEFDSIEKRTVEWLKTNNISQNIIILDEAQDLSEKEYEIIEQLHNKNKNLIAVGDDDQSIYEFRKEEHPEYIHKLSSELYHIESQELIENYRSCKSIVDFANQFREKNLGSKKLIPKKNVPGICELKHHIGKEMDSAVIKDIEKRKPTGSTAVLTYENAEAYRIFSALKVKLGDKYQIKIIEGKENGYIKLYDLEEFRCFIEKLNIKKDSNKPISGSIWKNAKAQFAKNDLVNKALNIFEKNYPDRRYNDLINYLKESTIDDYGTNEENCIVVSTIHRSKGKEFDNVYILLYNNYPYQEAYEGAAHYSNYNFNNNNKYNEQYEYNISKKSYNKTIYVGITRARKFLQIHYEKSVINVFEDKKEYDNDTKCFNAEYYSLQLNPSDIRLDFYKTDDEIREYYKNKTEITIKNIIRKLRKNNPINTSNDYTNFINIIKNTIKNQPIILITDDYTPYLYTNSNINIGILSNDQSDAKTNKGLKKISNQIDKGYMIEKIVIGQKVYYKYNDTNGKEKEIIIPLPLITFIKSEPQKK